MPSTDAVFAGSRVRYALDGSCLFLGSREEESFTWSRSVHIDVSCCTRASIVDRFKRKVSSETSVVA
jgi:hypothetical protein